MDQHNLHQVAIESIKAAPPVTATTMTILGYPLNEWLVLVTMAYTVCLFYTLWRDKLGGKETTRKLRAWLNS